MDYLVLTVGRNLLENKYKDLLKEINNDTFIKSLLKENENFEILLNKTKFSKHGLDVIFITRRKNNKTTIIGHIILQPLSVEEMFHLTFGLNETYDEDGNTDSNVLFFNYIYESFNKISDVMI